MKKIVILIFLVLYFLSLPALVQEDADLFNFFFGSEPNCAYSKWESHIVEGIANPGYNMYSPFDVQTDGFGQFTLPDENQTIVWETAVDHFFNEQYATAQTVLTQNGIPYSVVEFTDGNQVYYMLRENLNLSYYDNNGTSLTHDDENGSFDYGWGIFIYRSTNPKPVIVTAPHPNDDFISPYLSVKSFIELEAQYLMINGSGREVMWSEYGGYNNSKSLSDPSRNENHPFNYVYKKACDKIREDYDRRELSVQLHSYDWTTHPDKASCQISPGNTNRPAGIPIRDYSPLRQDVIQYTDYIVIPQGSIGNNSQVTVDEYYSVHKYFYDTVYQDTLVISSDVDLPGYQYSFHDQYTSYDYNVWDVISPFFHVEFDELPDCYPQTDESFAEFYGYNSYSETWNLNQKYTKMNQYYQPFISALGDAVADWALLNDGLIPDTPTNLTRDYNGSGNSITWDVSPCYDFYSYEILYSENPIAQGDYSILNRDENNKLAYPLTNKTSLSDLVMNENYYVAIRVLDSNGNSSDLSEEILFTSLPVETSSFEIYADEDEIQIGWLHYYHQNCLGYDIYRSVDDGDFELYDSYLNNSNLQVTSSYVTYNFTDTNLSLGNNYSYRVEIVNNQGTSFQASQIMMATLVDYITLNANGTGWNNSLVFGKSPFASHDYEYTYDELIYGGNSYLAFDYNSNHFSRNIISDFDCTETYQVMDIVFSNPPTNLTLSIDNQRQTERFYLDYNNQLYSLNDESINLNFQQQGDYYAKLYWGNLQTKVYFPSLANSVIYQGSSVDLTWELDFPDITQNLTLYFQNEIDSLFIADNILPNQNSYTFTNNLSNSYRFLNLNIALTSIDGEVITYQAPYKLVLQSELGAISLDSENSNTLFAYPFSNGFDVNNLSGELEVYTLINNQYNSTETMNNLNGYFVNILQDCEINYNGNPLLESYDYSLEQGWNLIYNPNPFSYQIKDLLFEKNNSIRSFYSMQNSQQIMPQVIGIKNGSYCIIDELNAYESAFLYQNISDDINIIFDPVNQSDLYSNPTPELYFIVEFKVSSGASDELVVGLHPGIESVIDNSVDAVKPPLRPTTGLKEAYIIPPPPLDSYFPKMHAKIQNLTSDLNYFWDIAFTNTTSQAVQVRIKDDNNVDNFPLELHFGGETYLLSHNFLTIPATDQAGTYNAELSIITQTDNDDNEVVPVSLFSIYPNPIAKQAKIIIDSQKNRPFNVEIYNLKGQRVKDFKNENPKTGKSEMTWDLTNNQGKRVSSGIYFVRYKDKENSRIKKVCIIK